MSFFPGRNVKLGGRHFLILSRINTGVPAYQKNTGPNGQFFATFLPLSQTLYSRLARRIFRRPYLGE
jgi:hypothetical protein